MTNINRIPAMETKENWNPSCIFTATMTPNTIRARDGSFSPIDHQAFIPAQKAATFFKYAHTTEEEAQQDADICSILCTPVIEENDDSSEEEDFSVTNRTDIMSAFVIKSPFSFENALFYSTPRPRVPSNKTPFKALKCRRNLFGSEVPKELVPAPAPNNSSSPKVEIDATAVTKIKEKIVRLKSQIFSSENSDGAMWEEVLKRYSKKMKAEEKSPPSTVYKIGLRALLELPKRYQWRIVEELAENARRESRYQEAIVLYRILAFLQPFHSLQWLNAAKMAEDNGEMKKALHLLQTGLFFCPINESLFVKLLKIYEKMGMKDSIRALLGSLKTYIERFGNNSKWMTTIAKLMIEGALFEAREGNEKVDQVVEFAESYITEDFTFYFELARQEEKLGHIEKAKKFCDLFIKKHGDITQVWFYSLQDAIQQNKYLYSQYLSQAWKNISHENIWKLHIENAFAAERHHRLEEARSSLAEAILQSAENVHWKLWLIGARIESKAHNLSVAQQLLNKCALDIPQKQQRVLLIEFARTFEFAARGAADSVVATRFYECARRHFYNDWKIHFECVVSQMRFAHFKEAQELIEKSLEIHCTTGRLWAIFIHLLHAKDPETVTAHKTFVHALHETPKSGEVWCEGARIYMSPLSRYYNLRQARRCLEFAIHFTPQYGDSFIELQRLNYIEKALGNSFPQSNVEQLSQNADPNYGILWHYCKRSLIDSVHEILSFSQSILEREIPDYISLFSGSEKNIKIKNCAFTWAGINQVGNLFLHPELREDEEKYRMIYGYEPIIV